MRASRLQRVDFITLFPAMLEGPMSESLIGRARDKGIVDVQIHNLRDFSDDKRHRKVDDRPYGGGSGMVIRAEPIFKALLSVRKSKHVFSKRAKPYVIYPSPQGKVLTQRRAHELALKSWLVFLCGHYEGIDERAFESVDEELSIGDYVLTGGELPAMVAVETILRLVPGVVKEPSSIANDSFQNGLLDHPHFTRPALWRGQRVPQVLLSGDHERIKQWRGKEARKATAKKRPDLFSKLNSK